MSTGFRMRLAYLVPCNDAKVALSRHQVGTKSPRLALHQFPIDAGVQQIGCSVKSTVETRVKTQVSGHDSVLSGQPDLIPDHIAGVGNMIPLDLKKIRSRFPFVQRTAMA